MAATPPRTPLFGKDWSHYAQSPTVSVIMGPEAKTFHIHEALLRENSEYFDAGLRSDSFEESRTRKFTMADDSPCLFGYFVNWLYAGHSRNRRADSLAWRGPPELVELYVFADKLMAEDLKNDIMDALQAGHQVSNVNVQLEQMVKLGERGFGESLLMSYSLNLLAWKMKHEGFTKYLEDPQWLRFVQVDGKLITQVIKLLDLFEQVENPGLESGCKWHEHKIKPGKPCVRAAVEAVSKQFQSKELSDPLFADATTTQIGSTEPLVSRAASPTIPAATPPTAPGASLPPAPQLAVPTHWGLSIPPTRRYVTPPARGSVTPRIRGRGGFLR